MPKVIIPTNTRVINNLLYEVIHNDYFIATAFSDRTRQSKPVSIPAYGSKIEFKLLVWVRLLYTYVNRTLVLEFK